MLTLMVWVCFVCCVVLAFVVRRVRFVVVRCVVSVGVGRWLLPGVCRLLYVCCVVRCSLFVAGCLCVVVRCRPMVFCSLCAVRCVLFVVRCRCCLFLVVICLLCVRCLMLAVACSLLLVVWCMLCVA